MRKRCSKCKKNKQLRFFGQDPRYRLGVKGWCKACEREYQNKPKSKKKRKEYWDNKMSDPKNREKERKRSRRKYWKNRRKIKDQVMRKSFGISLRKFERTRRCLLCKRMVQLVADHNHETDKYRGALCRICNLMIGWIEKFPNMLKKVKSYLRRG